MAPLMRSVNRESYSGVFNAMFMGVVRILWCSQLSTWYACPSVISELRPLCVIHPAVTDEGQEADLVPTNDVLVMCHVQELSVFASVRSIHAVSQIDIIDTFRRKVLHTDSIYCLKGYNALFEPAPFRHGITHSPAVQAAAARVARWQVAPTSDVEQGLQLGPGGAAQQAAPATPPAQGGNSGAHSTAAAAQMRAAKRVRGARDDWASEWSAPVPRSYCFSPSLVPRPADWPDHVNAVGFCRDPNAGDDSTYTPPPELEAFLAVGPKPVYIGFGSMTIDDPEVWT